MHGRPPIEYSVTEKARTALEDYIDTRVRLWGLDASDLWTADEVRKAFFP